MSDSEPAFNLQDVQELVAAMHRLTQLQIEQALQQQAAVPFCLLIQGASPQTETEWLEREFEKPSAEGERG